MDVMDLKINRIEQIQIWNGIRHLIQFERKTLRLLESDETTRNQIANITNLRTLKRKINETK